MPRYFAKAIRPRADWFDDDSPMVPQITVCDHEAEDTGLVDSAGDPIWRAPNPIRFGRDGEW